MKVIELERAPNDRRGQVNKNKIRLEPHEEKTINYLTLYGFDIEVVRPVNTPKINNPDIFIAGSLWEMKAPSIYNENTLKKHFKKASKQSDKVVFDLRGSKKDVLKIERFIVNKFKEPGRIRRMIVIRKNGRVFDFFK